MSDTQHRVTTKTSLNLRQSGAGSDPLSRRGLTMNILDMILTAWERALKRSVFVPPKRERLVCLRNGEMLIGAYTDDEVRAMQGIVMVVG